MNASTTISTGRPEKSRFSLLWLSVFALLSIFTLLFAFQRVVHAAVDKAQADRIQQNDQAQALWLCNRLPARAERRACVATAAGTVRLPDALVASSTD
ncbi:MAG: hypothetical protein ABIQ29_08790 [Burkholderiaceae bacterium]